MKINQKKKKNLFDSQKLSGIKIHAHVDSAKSATTNQLAFAPSDGRGHFERRRRNGFGEESGFANARIDLVD